MELNQFVTKNLARRYKKIDESERRDHVEKAKNGNNTSREIVLTSSYRYIIASAAKWIKYNIPLCDLITVGVIGCNRAIDEFDQSINVTFLTYAEWWITRTIQKEIADNSKTIRIPQGVVSDTNKYWKVVNRTGDSTKHTEIEKAAKLLPCQRETIERLPTTSSLNAPAYADGPERIGMVRGHDDIPANDIANKDLVSRLTKCLSELESKVIQLRFEEGLTLKDIGELLNVCRERVRQIEEHALKKMRKHYSLLQDKNIDASQQFSNKKQYQRYKKIRVEAL